MSIPRWLALTAPGGTGEALTARERDVLRLLSIDLSNEEIGRQLFISAETVRTHVGKALTKLQASTRAHAVATALRRSLIS
jgi:DNA-binding CsgD family transcriptional regulator